MPSKIQKVAEGFLSRVTDIVLASIFFQLEIALSSAKTRGQVDYAAQKAEATLSEINYKKIKRALRELKRKGLIKTIKNNILAPEITALGQKRLKEIIPQYQTKRPWDGSLYLVTYDIPITHNSNRQTLWYFLKKIGCGRLQESIWVTPYNPTKIVKEFVDERNLTGTILVSTLGKDGSIGEMTLQELIEEVYHLSSLNQRYQEFLSLARHDKNKERLVFAYLSILNNDPQLPFQLLPDDWVGDEAYQVFKRLTK